MSACRLLLVDDYDIVRQGVRALISAQAGWEVCGEARSGGEALRMAAELRPDVVVMDLLMPDMNGIDAARQMRKAVPTAVIVILSGHGEGELVRGAFEAGVRGYVLKSEARTHLVPAIAAVMAGKRYPESEVWGRGDGEELPVLTAREREIVQWLAGGHSNKEIAAGLGIQVKTVETHRASIMRKLNLGSLSELVRYAIRRRIIEA